MSVVKFPGLVEENKSLEVFLENITELIKDKKITSLMAIAYVNDEDDPSFFMAGNYIKPREILGDLKLMEAVVLDEVILDEV